MKRFFIRLFNEGCTVGRMILVTLFLLFPAAGRSVPAELPAKVCNNLATVGQTSGPLQYYGVEINGTLCGYLEIRESSLSKGGIEVLRKESRTYIMLSFLGSDFNSETITITDVDKRTGRMISMNSETIQPTRSQGIKFGLDGKTASIFMPGQTDAISIETDSETVIGGDELLRRIWSLRTKGNSSKEIIPVLELAEGKIQISELRFEGTEKLLIAGSEYDCEIFEQSNSVTGVKTKYWISEGKDYFIRIQNGNRDICLADKNIVGRIRVGDMDSKMITRSNKKIPDILKLKSLKVRVEIAPSGFLVEERHLNTAGQLFEGSVEGGRVEGVFTISEVKYRGENAPAFPFRTNDKEIQKYIMADERVQSDDPFIRSKASELTSGARTSWEAVRRLSQWVSDSIFYGVPGGTARQTLDTRKGECGAHSFLLASLCRAVGIPARVVWGALYIPNYGGAFGQHAWNEVFMGETAGWIQIDATASQPDFVDVGHIRISEYNSPSNKLNGEVFEIIAFEEKAGAGKSIYEPYLGNYGDGTNATHIVQESGSSIKLSISGQNEIPFKEPDERGRWVCTKSPYLYLSFGQNGDGKVTSMQVHDIILMKRKDSPGSSSERFQGELAKFAGEYSFPSAGADFRVTVEDGVIYFFDPLEKTNYRMRPTEYVNEWTDEKGINTISFIQGSDGQILYLKLDYATKYIKN